jgi:hypothetical protein
MTYTGVLIVAEPTCRWSIQVHKQLKLSDNQLNNIVLIFWPIHSPYKVQKIEVYIQWQSFAMFPRGGSLSNYIL